MAHPATRLARPLRARSTVLPAQTLQVPILTKLTVLGPTLPALQSAALWARQTAKAEAHSEARSAEWAVCMITAASGRITAASRCLVQHSHAQRQASGQSNRIRVWVGNNRYP